MVKKLMKETSPAGALEQVGTVMPRIIDALATALISENPIHFSKLDIKDGFWRMVYAFGEECNFACDLLNHLKAPTELVMPSVLQMGWKFSPYFFHVVSETARDVAE